MLPRASRHSSEPKWSIPRLRRLWLPLALGAVALATVVMLAAGGSGAAGALLSQGRPASANSSYSGCRPGAANDGSLSTRWMAGSGAYPQRWTVDLGAAQRLGLVSVTWQRANNRVYGYRIVASNDRSTWTVLRDRRANATIGTTADAVSGAYRYVRVTVLGSTYGWAQIYEVRVYAAGTAAPPATPTPRPAAAPPATPTPTPTMTFSTPTPTATVVFSPTPTPAPTPTATTIGAPASGGSVTAANTSATAIDAAISAAKAKGPGTTVFFPRGDYSHATLTWPDGINLRGAGIGATRLDFALKFGSNSFIENATMGGTQSTSFSFVNGAHDSVFEDVRFRGRGFSLWQATDFTSEFNDGVVNRSGNFHDVAFRRAEFEYTGVADGDLWSIWWDARAGGGSIYDVTWEDCVFGAKNSTGAFGQGRMGILIQPSPPEHASDGPRPGAAITGSTDYNFDWSQVTHGSGTAIPAADYGFRITGCYFVGPASLSSFDLCDYIRAWAMTTYHIPTSSPGNVTQAMRDAAPDRMATKGVYVENTFFSGKWTKEFGRDVSDINNTKSGGTGSYNVPAIVKTHDAGLYGS